MKDPRGIHLGESRMDMLSVPEALKNVGFMMDNTGNPAY